MAISCILLYPLQYRNDTIRKWRVLVLLAVMNSCLCPILAQSDTTVTGEQEEDFSMYDNLDFADGGTKRYCTSKVLDLSPTKLISVSYDVQGPYDLQSDSVSSIAAGEGKIKNSHGIRLGFNVPVYSRNSLIVQAGMNYSEQQYTINSDLPLAGWLANQGLRSTSGIITVFKPINEQNFFIAQAQTELSGNYSLSDWQPLNTLRYSGAVIWGWKKNDRKMIGFGLTRSYRAGNLNYIPAILLNWTSSNRKWGAEVLAPARAHIRRTFSPRKMLFFGYELEGSSYRLANKPEVTSPFSSHELRRSELRIRGVYEQSIKGFIWISVQAGFRYNYEFNTDELPGNKEFFRGFFGDQPYAMQNEIGHTFYTMVGIHLVSP